MHVLGIDAGGTKTVCLLADEHGNTLGQGRGPGANLQASGELEVEKVLHDVMEQATGGDHIRPEAICLGIAGVDRPGDADAVRGIMRRIGFRTPVVVVNDAQVALTAGAGDAPGIVVISGTGSIAYGRTASGEATRAGGWGYLLGDEGGGFWIGRAALAAVVRQFDGRGPSTLLTDLVLQHMKLDNPTELIHAIYDRGMQRIAVAGIASVIQEAVENGDAVAGEIVGRATSELIAAAAAVIRRLEMRGDPFPTILSGGTFRGIQALVHGVTEGLGEVAPRSEVRLLSIEPAVGAVQMALAHLRGTLKLPRYI